MRTSWRHVLLVAIFLGAALGALKLQAPELAYVLAGAAMASVLW